MRDLRPAFVFLEDETVIAEGYAICDCCQMYCLAHRRDDRWKNLSGFDLCSQRCVDYFEAGLLDEERFKQASERTLELILKDGKKCPKCKQETLHKNGRNKGRQSWRCRNPECSYTRIDGAGIHGSEPKVKTEALTPLEKNHRSKPPTGTARTGLYWYVICTNNTKDGFIALVRGNRKALRKANPGKHVRLLSGYPAGMRRWLWERRTENNNSNSSEELYDPNG